MYGCLKASSADMRVDGLKSRRREIKSRASEYM